MDLNWFWYFPKFFGIAAEKGEFTIAESVCHKWSTVYFAIMRYNVIYAVKCGILVDFPKSNLVIERKAELQDGEERL